MVDYTLRLWRDSTRCRAKDYVYLRRFQGMAATGSYMLKNVRAVLIVCFETVTVRL